MLRPPPQEITEELKSEFGRKRTTADKMFETLPVGEEVGVNYSAGPHSFILKLDHAYALAIEPNRLKNLAEGTYSTPLSIRSATSWRQVSSKVGKD